MCIKTGGITEATVAHSSAQFCRAVRGLSPIPTISREKIAEVLARITRPALDQWWMDRVANPQHPAIISDGVEYLLYLDCSAATALGVARAARDAGYLCEVRRLLSNGQPMNPRVAVYIAPGTGVTEEEG